MSDYKMLLYADKPRLPTDPPGDWPCFLQLADGPVVAPWIPVTLVEFDAYKVAHQSSYDDWYDNYYLPKQAQLDKIDATLKFQSSDIANYDNYVEFGLAIPADIVQMKLDRINLEAQRVVIENEPYVPPN